jgi:hypothetical protein
MKLLGAGALINALITATADLLILAGLALLILLAFFSAGQRSR